MYRSTNRSNHLALVTSVALAAALVLGLVAASPAFAAARKPMIVAQDCRQSINSEYTLHFGNGSALAPNCMTGAVPATGAAAVQPQFVEDSSNTVAQDCRQGSGLEFNLRYGNGSALPPTCMTVAIPVTGAAAVQPQFVDEGSHLQLDLMWGKGNTRFAASQANSIPVTGASRDFGTSYWMMISPPGAGPVNTGQ